LINQNPSSSSFPVFASSFTPNAPIKTRRSKLQEESDNEERKSTPNTKPKKLSENYFSFRSSSSSHEQREEEENISRQLDLTQFDSNSHSSRLLEILKINFSDEYIQNLFLEMNQNENQQKQEADFYQDLLNFTENHENEQNKMKKKQIRDMKFDFLSQQLENLLPVDGNINHQVLSLSISLTKKNEQVENLKRKILLLFLLSKRKRKNTKQKNSNKRFHLLSALHHRQDRLILFILLKTREKYVMKFQI
jgi:hypothetical protein